MSTMFQFDLNQILLCQKQIYKMESTSANVYDICKTALLADYLTVQASSINRKFLNKFIPPKQKVATKLIDHVQQLFNLSDSEMEQLIRNCETFCTEEFALVDLLIRKNMLDQDLTPNYTPDDFDVEDDYDLWKNAELAELDTAINYIIQHYPHTENLCHTALPTQNAKLCFIPSDPKTVYYALLEHLISFEDTLSNASTLLLSECGRRWRLSLAFRAYSYLNLIWKNNKSSKFSSTLRICEMILHKEFLLNNQEKYDVYLIFKKVEKLCYKQLEQADLLSLPWTELTRVLNKVYLNPVYRKFHKPDIPSLRIAKVIEKSIVSRLSPLAQLDLSECTTAIAHMIKDMRQIDKIEIEDDQQVCSIFPLNLFKSSCEAFLQKQLATLDVPDNLDHILQLLDQCQVLKELGLAVHLPDELLQSALNEYMEQTLSEMREWSLRAISLDTFDPNDASNSSCVSDVFDVLRTKWLDIRDTCWYDYEIIAMQRLVIGTSSVVVDVAKHLFESVVHDLETHSISSIDKLNTSSFDTQEMKSTLIKLNDLHALQEKLNLLFEEINAVYLNTIQPTSKVEAILCRLSIGQIKNVVKLDTHENKDVGFLTKVQINDLEIELYEGSDDFVDFHVKNEQQITISIYSRDLQGQLKKYAHTTFTITEDMEDYYDATPRSYNLNTLLGQISIHMGHVHSEMPWFYFNKAYTTLNDFLTVSSSKVVFYMMAPCDPFLLEVINMKLPLDVIEEHLQPVFNYLNIILGDVVEKCHSSIATHLLKRAWKHVLALFEKVLMSHDDITSMHYMFNCLEEFFHAQGSGLQLTHLHCTEYHRLNALFKLCQADNDVLMQHYLRSFVNYAVHKVEKFKKTPVDHQTLKRHSSSSENEEEEQLIQLGHVKQPNTPLTPAACEAVVLLLESRAHQDQEVAEFLYSQEGIQKQVILNLELEKMKREQFGEKIIESVPKSFIDDYRYQRPTETSLKRPLKSKEIERIPKSGVNDLEQLVMKKDSTYYAVNNEYN